MINFTLFLDESGNDQLFSCEEFRADNKLETHCSLCGVIVPHHKKDELTEKVNALKFDIWDRMDIIFHSVDIRNKRGAFSVFQDEAVYTKFKRSINQITLDTSLKIICISLNKFNWVEKYPRKFYFGDNPYNQAFIFLLERYATYLNGNNAVKGRIIAEKREARKDRTLQTTLDHIKRYGTQYKTPDYFSKIDDKIDFHSKTLNIPGLQIADYFSYPLYFKAKFPTRTNVHHTFLIPHCLVHKIWP